MVEAYLSYPGSQTDNNSLVSTSTSWPKTRQQPQATSTRQTTITKPNWRTCAFRQKEPLRSPWEKRRSGIQGIIMERNKLPVEQEIQCWEDIDEWIPPGPQGKILSHFPHIKNKNSERWWQLTNGILMKEAVFEKSNKFTVFSVL